MVKYILNSFLKQDINASSKAVGGVNNWFGAREKIKKLSDL